MAVVSVPPFLLFQSFFLVRPVITVESIGFSTMVEVTVARDDSLKTWVTACIFSKRAFN